MTFDEISNKICAELPEGWEITVCFEKDAGYVELVNRDIGKHVEYPTNYETIIQQMEDALEHAKGQELGGQPMGRFKFYLNERQKLLVSGNVELSRKADTNGKTGAVFCQLGNSKDRPGEMLAVGAFIPDKYASRIKAVLDEYFKSIGLL